MKIKIFLSLAILPLTNLCFAQQTSIPNAPGTIFNTEGQVTDEKFGQKLYFKEKSPVGEIGTEKKYFVDPGHELHPLTNYSDQKGTPPSVLAPANDPCASAIGLTAGTPVTGDNSTATLDGAFASCDFAGGNPKENVWYTITPATSGVLTLTLAAGTNYYPFVEIYTGSCAALTLLVGCGNGTTTTYTNTACVIGSTTYYVMVYNDTKNSSAGGTYTLTPTLLSTANDICASATPLALSTTFNATLQTLTYSVQTVSTNTCAAADQSSTACFNNFHNVWFTFVPPVTGNYYVGVDGAVVSGILTDPQVAVLSGGCGGFTLVGCAGGLGQTGQPDGGIGYDYTYAGGCNLTAGTTYYVMVDDLNGSYVPGNIPGAQGTFTLTIASLSNDIIDNAGILPSCGTAFTGSTIGATNCTNCQQTGSSPPNYSNLDCNTTVATGATGGSDVYPGMSVENDSWFQFCTTTAQTYSITMAPVTATCVGPNTALQMNIYTGTPAALVWVAGNGTSTSLTLTVALAANGCAYIDVDGNAGTNCDYNLTLTASPGCPLPVDIISFRGDNMGESKIKLDWSVSSEKDLNYYLVERSADGVNYKQVSKIKAMGNSLLKGSYSTVDENSLTGFNYYRLIAVDLNGLQNTAATTMVTNRSHLPNFGVYPNPTTGKLKINLANFSSPAVAIEVYDMYGKQIYFSSVTLDNGNALQEIDLSAFPQGVYFVKASDGENVFKQTIVIRK